MLDERQISDTEENRIYIMEKYGEVSLACDSMTEIITCSFFGGKGSWSYVGFGADYDLGLGPDALTPVEETYLALEQLMWNEIDRADLW